MRVETQAILQRVIAKATKLSESRYIRHLVDQPYKIDFREGGFDVTKPDDEARDAFVLTLRFFLARNEKTSFEGLARLLNDNEISDNWKLGFRALKSAIDDYLGTAFGQYEYGGATHRFSNREILNAFLYGGLVHANSPEAITRYEEWTRDPYVYAILQLWFIATTQTLVRGITALARMCRAELDTVPNV